MSSSYIPSPVKTGEKSNLGLSKDMILLDTASNMEGELKTTSRSPTTCVFETDEPNALLLELPPEIRNQIYRYVLVLRWPRRVRVSKETSVQPALLQTCRQIRQEASDIFKRDNDIALFVAGSKIEPQPQHWLWSVPRIYRLCPSCDSEYPPNWSTMELWCKVVHENGMIIDHVSCPGIWDRFFINDALVIVDQMRVTTWERTRIVLDIYRLSVQRANQVEELDSLLDNFED